MDKRSETAVALLIGLASMALPVTWWVRVVLLMATLAIAGDLLWRSPLTSKLSRTVRGLLILATIAVVSLISWKPLDEQFEKEGGIDVLLTAAGWFFDSEYFRLLIAAVIGALIGNQFAPLRPALPLGRTKVHPWPNVKEWLSPPKALEKFGDKALLEAMSFSWKEMNEARAQANAIPADQRPDEYTILSRAFDKSEPLKEGSLQFYLNKADQAHEKYYNTRAILLANFRQQLQRETLVAKGVSYEDNKPGEWEVIKSAYWTALDFDPIDPSLDWVQGGGKAYRGLQIGET